ncbi:MAG: 16S rRNA (uracil(1498)-N(3))-methyltransferase [Candidatus Dojkabacteria bacterium]|nr:16S rRNA (uracil(1498)-N(3))-methyltransferase [Candidatus Dojkabacteria bacterium]
MKLRRFYIRSKNIKIGSEVQLEDFDNAHIKKVLRLKPGSTIVLFNGDKEYLAELKKVTNKFVTAIVKSLKQIKEQQTSEITLFLSLIKKLDDTIKILNELGLHKIYFLKTEYCQLKKESIIQKMQRIEKILISSSKQCNRIDYIHIMGIIDFEDIQIQNTLSKEHFDLIYFLTPHCNQKFNLCTENLANKKIAYFIGPEGGFSEKEHTIARNLGFKFIRPFENILRSEHASTSFLCILKYLLNN